ncbi:MAG: hypothetical protein RBG13Loki_4297 [Promethearchaeota archaeon CR_4]|nr:MAG: hypothetical protein RBG13Loki_4297 [Candidatus Lokiarchaeota archaeon CR_4]
MSKSSGIGVAVVALLVGGVALGWMVYAQVISPPQTTASPTTRVQVVYQSGGVATNPVDTYLSIPDFTINFTLEPGERVLLTYSCEAVIEASTISTETLEAFFVVNGTIPGGWPNAMERILKGDTSVYTAVYVSYSPPLNWLPTGTHNVTVNIRGSNTASLTYQYVLTVQIYAT